MHQTPADLFNMDLLERPITADMIREWRILQLLHGKKSALAACIRHERHESFNIFLEGEVRGLKISAIQAAHKRFANFPIELIAKFLHDDHTRWILQFSHGEYWVRPVLR